MPLAFYAVGIEPCRQGKACPFFLRKALSRRLPGDQIRPSRREAVMLCRIRQGKGQNAKARRCPKKREDRLLVFLYGKGTGGVQKQAAGPKKPCRLCRDFFLDPRVIIRPLLLPVPRHGRVLSEHPLAGAGGVDEDFVEKALEIADKPLRAFAGHQNIFRAEQLQIF